jgi:D-xylose transport system substrate-binding protein
MRTRVLGGVALGIAATVILTACGSDSKSDSSADKSGASGSKGAPAGKVGVILPDTQTSPRWESFDKPLLTKAFADAGVSVDIQNAQGDKNKMSSIADAMIQGGVSVLAIVNLDSATGAQIEAKAKQQQVKTIDYDRLTLGGSADYYVSFDNTTVGVLQGQGLVKCLGGKVNANIIELNGSPTDNNATLFKNGYDSVLNAKYADGWKKVGDKSVPNWDAAKAVTIFEQLFTSAGGKVDGVVAANDTLADAVIQTLKKNRLTIPVTGQDATAGGLQNILRGSQCMTVYKSIKEESSSLASLAISMLKGEKGKTTGVTKDTQANRDVPSVILIPKAITKENVKLPISDGFVKAAAVCTADVKEMCTKAGIS